MDYRVTVEAHGYGDPLEDGEKFLAAVGELGIDPLPQCAQDEDRNMLMVTFELDAPDARDAHDEALGLWETAWETAFEDLAPPTALAIRAQPAGDRAAVAAEEA